MSRGRQGKSGLPWWVILIIVLALINSGWFGGLMTLLGVAAIGVIIYFTVKAATDGKKKNQAETAAHSRSAAEAARSNNQTTRRSDSGQTAQTAARSDAAASPQTHTTPQQTVQPPQRRKPKYPPEVQAVVDEGEKAHEELTRLYTSIPELSVKHKIQELIDVSDKIIADAVADPSDVPQIKKFLDYYLPTTIKLLNSYDRMGAQGIEGENITRTMQSIEEMLDTAIEAYKKLLDSLFADQAMDVETDIQVMNTLLKREGLSGGSAFQAMEK